jgi:hypothetical protein
MFYYTSILCVIILLFSKTPSQSRRLSLHPLPLPPLSNLIPQNPTPPPRPPTLPPPISYSHPHLNNPRDRSRPSTNHNHITPYLKPSPSINILFSPNPNNFQILETTHNQYANPPYFLESVCVDLPLKPSLHPPSPPLFIVRVMYHCRDTHRTRSPFLYWQKKTNLLHLPFYPSVTLCGSSTILKSPTSKHSRHSDSRA